MKLYRDMDKNNIQGVSINKTDTQIAKAII